MKIGEIEDGVPPPVRHKAGALRVALGTMDVGQSIFVSGGKDGNIRRVVSYVGDSLSRKFTVSAVDGGMRIWRLE